DLEEVQQEALEASRQGITGDLEEVQQEAREASRQGITGVPFFAAYRKGTQKEPLTFSGAHPPKTLLKAIQSIAAEVAE
ncbi:hypothetical protein T484DRAFT_1823744, partial [Baffinella frigidus]